MEACRIPVAGIGYSTVEAIPIYHYMSGADALRLLVPPVRRGAPFECDFCYVGELDAESANVSWGWVGCDDVAGLARRWRVSAVLLDGVEPALNAGGDVVEVLSRGLKDAGIAVGLRWQGLTPLPGTVGGGVIDFVLVDYVPGAYREAQASYAILKALEFYEPWRSDYHLEVAVFVEKPVLQLLTPLLQHVSGKEVPLHVFIEDPYGGGAVVDLYRQLKERTPYVYIHADPYSELDTQCPSCSTVVAVRTEGVLHTLALDSGKCPKCGRPILFRKVVNVKTPRRVLRETRGETVWYQLGSLPVRVDFSSQRGST